MFSSALSDAVSGCGSTGCSAAGSLVCGSPAPTVTCGVSISGPDDSTTGTDGVLSSGPDSSVSAGCSATG